MIPVGTAVTLTNLAGATRAAVITGYETLNAWECPSGRRTTVDWPIVSTEDGHTFTSDPDRVTAR